MFKFFRRYQKIFIVVGGVILMLAFTVADPLSKWVQGRNEELGRRDPNATAVTWKGGKLTEGELSRLVYNRHIANSFVRGVYAYGSQIAEMSGLSSFGPRVQPIGIIDPNWTQDTLDREVLMQHVLAERGRKMGIVISDKAISDYIEDLGRGELASEQLHAILQASGGNRPVSADEIYAILRDVMLADAALQAYGAGPTGQNMLAAELPMNRWEEWKRTNDRVVLEAAAIDPNSSMLDVAEPTEKELREFYDKYKEQFAFPAPVLGVELPPTEPGFHLPRKVTLKYLRANFEEYVARYEKEITDEQVAAYYEEHKNPMFISAELEETEVEVEETPAGELPSEETSEEATETPEASESTEAPAAEGETPAAEPPTEPASDSAPAAEAPEGEGAAVTTASPFRLAAYQQTPEESAAAEALAEESSDTAAPAAESAATTETPAEETVEVEAEEEEIKFQPLDEVKDEIRRRLAEDKFFDGIDAVMQGAIARLKPAYSQYLGQKLDAEAVKKPVPAPPAQLVDLGPIAKELNLEFEETGELDIVQLRDSNIGKTVGDQKYRGTPLWRLVFADEIDMYEPMLTLDIGRFGDRYLVMKIADEPARVPTFEEAKDQVLTAWKQQQAAKLALAKAEEIAKKVQESGLDLKAYFVDQPEVEVTKTSPFTQFTEGDIAPTSRMPSYRLSQPQGLKDVGPKFIEDAFKLKQGEVTALPNHNESVIYIVRMADEYESDEQLRSDFLQQANFWPGRAFFLTNNMDSARGAALRALFNDIDIKWERPDQSEEDEE